jgi:hypothetical protein
MTDHKVAEGVFEDLYLGDYFILQDGTYNVEWMIAGFDVEFMAGKDDATNRITEHCLMLIPKGPGVLKARMHSSDTTAGGIVNSEIASTLTNIENIFVGTFGSHMKKHLIYMANRANAETGSPTGINTGTGTIPVLMNIVEVCGSNYNTFADNFMAASGTKNKLPIFNVYKDPRLGGDYWFENIRNATQFATTRHEGCSITGANASNASYYVRPKITIG